MRERRSRSRVRAKEAAVKVPLRRTSKLNME
jgi:hypothetical protein